MKNKIMRLFSMGLVLAMLVTVPVPVRAADTASQTGELTQSVSDNETSDAVQPISETGDMDITDTIEEPAASPAGDGTGDTVLDDDALVDTISDDIPLDDTSSDEESGDTSSNDDGEIIDTIEDSDEDSTELPPDDDNVIIEEDDKPYLALGADLSEEQRAVVLDLMGIKAEDLDSYNVSYVTNTEEHQYLDSYISTSEIGSKSWSSVVIVKRDKGSGINISTKNINYCTVGMYKNALVTAGIADADIIVAGPKPISGTAALVGIFKAYTEIEGGALTEESIDTALNELVLTGKLESATGASAEEIESMVAYLKQKVAEGALDSEATISEAIDEACEQFEVILSEDEKNQLIDLMLKIKDLDLDVDDLLAQAQSIYDKLSQWGLDTTDTSGIGAKIGSFFSGIVDAIKSFFANLF